MSACNDARSPAALSNEPVRLLPDMADMLAIAAVARRVAGEKASKSEAEPELYPVNDPAPREPWSPLEAVARSDR